MRFFRPALSPFVFSIANKSIKKIHISDDLSTLKLSSIENKAEMNKIFSVLKKSMEELPINAKLTVNRPNFQVSRLCDVAIELSKIINQIKAIDPGFFAELAFYEESLNSDVVENPLSLDDFVNSPLHLYFFQLQSLRRESVQHTIEFPLRSLVSNGLLSQSDLNQIMLKIWLKTSAVRKEKASALAMLPTMTDAVPYVFRMR